MLHMGGVSPGVGQRQEQKMTKFQSFNEDDYTLCYQTHLFVPRGYKLHPGQTRCSYFIFDMCHL